MPRPQPITERSEAKTKANTNAVKCAAFSAAFFPWSFWSSSTDVTSTGCVALCCVLLSVLYCVVLEKRAKTAAGINAVTFNTIKNLSINETDCRFLSCSLLTTLKFGTR